MKTIEEVTQEITYSLDKSTKQVLHSWQKEIIQHCIDTLRNYKAGEPELGQDDYIPGKYMSIGILYELQENI